MLKLGLDIGGVLIKSANENVDTSFLFRSDYTKSPAVDGAIEAVNRLHTHFDLYIISKCGRKIEQRSREWLRANGIEALIPESKWRFCKQRTDKGPIAAELGLSCFVDDKLEVLYYMRSVKYRFLFQPKQIEIDKWKHAMHNVYKVDNWSVLVDKLLRISS